MVENGSQKWAKYANDANGSSLSNAEKTSDQGLHDKAKKEISRLLQALIPYGQRNLTDPANITKAATWLTYVSKTINGEHAHGNGVFKAAEQSNSVSKTDNSEVAPQARPVYVPRPG
jgi:hypothetical protein